VRGTRSRAIWNGRRGLRGRFRGFRADMLRKEIEELESESIDGGEGMEVGRGLGW
jgi:hypothetical protein